MKYASLVLLSYHRADLMMRGLHTLLSRRAGYPYELIVVDDGSRDAAWPYLFKMLKEQKISRLVLNGGSNLGVGEGMRVGFGIATGAYLIKLDADLEYSEGWLKKGIDILEGDPEVACAGFFNYRSYSPKDERFNILEKRTLANGQEYGVVDDFVSSALIFSRETFEKFGPLSHGSAAYAEDVLFKKKLQAAGLKLAITIPDCVKNVGFGLGKSEVVKEVNGVAEVTKIAQEPLLFER